MAFWIDDFFDLSPFLISYGCIDNWFLIREMCDADCGCLPFFHLESIMKEVDFESRVN